MTIDKQNLFAAALTVLRKEGYGAFTFARVADEAKIDIAAIQAQFPDKSALYAALIAAYNPSKALHAALDDVTGDTAEDIIRDAMHRLIDVISRHEDFIDLAAIDVQTHNGASLLGMSVQLAPKLLSLLNRLKKTGEIRPVSDLILARTIASMLMGFVVSEQAMPKVARMAMRLFPQRAWLDGMIDLMLYGILEDNVR
jgi:AcrR family transcriptional regulator